MSKRNFLFIDNETMGVDDRATILSVGALMVTEDDFDKHPEDLLVDNARTWKLQLPEQREFKRTVKKETVDWWKEQSDEARRVLKPLDTDVSMAQFLDELVEWTKDLGYSTVGRSWLNGGIFQRGTIDYPQIASMARCVHGTEDWLYEHLDWRRVRDIKSIIDTLNLGGFNALNIYSVPCNEAVEEYTNGDYKVWWDYVESFKERYELVAHDAASDCLIQFEQLKLMGLTEVGVD